MALATQRWLDQTREKPLDPALEICDPHHHLWDRPESRYMLKELVADAEGHNVTKTVFVECMSMYNADVPEALRPVGETEFVQGVAAMSASGAYGDMRAAVGIVSFADLTLGAAVDEVLEAHVRPVRPASAASVTLAAGTRATLSGTRTRNLWRGCCLILAFGRALRAWRSATSSSMPGSTTRSSSTWWISREPSRAPPSSSTTSGAHWESDPMRVSARRCSRSGKQGSTH